MSCSSNDVISAKDILGGEEKHRNDPSMNNLRNYEKKKSKKQKH